MQDPNFPIGASEDELVKHLDRGLANWKAQEQAQAQAQGGGAAHE